MQWSDVQFDPTAKTLKQFAACSFGFFGGAALYQGLYRGHTNAALILGAIALGSGLLGLVAPKALKPIFVAWMVLAFPIGWTISLLMLAVMYYGLFTPIGLIFKLIGRDPLERTLQPAAATYWTPKTTPKDARRYFKQF
ncbi:SxtJ family membrane protein [Paludisphaera mucosa]|uniref:SxtJ family membrane protein n=1 Tax=Paludisphaera mucosa TaxID=3030827 RepID=A0ABT6FLA3_9BACT|nr:SxtJ family membrane protein [Paludisphaera mucosa]MDG3008140.1 SxtJ family membrane protein [Paludisphaera mucosa]